MPGPYSSGFQIETPQPNATSIFWVTKMGSKFCGGTSKMKTDGKWISLQCALADNNPLPAQWVNKTQGPFEPSCNKRWCCYYDQNTGKPECY